METSGIRGISDAITVSTTSSSVLTVQGPDSYTVTVDATTGAMHTHETLSAHRLGDCTR